MNTGIKQYAIVTASYWGFTLTDGALRMLILLHFHVMGYTPLQLASLFLLYEIAGIVTNLTAGWLGSRLGLGLTLHMGLALQIAALLMLSFMQDDWPHHLMVTYALLSQGLSGVAKDFTKMSSKSALKLVVPDDSNSKLFKWVGILTGSKNTLKGIGFFLGGLLLTQLGFQNALWAQAIMLAVILTGVLFVLPSNMGKLSTKVKFKEILSKSTAINMLSSARLFLFGARDVWFVVGLPLFLYDVMNFTFTQVGTMMASWVIIYGFVQSFTPNLMLRRSADCCFETKASRFWIAVLSTIPFAMLFFMMMDINAGLVVLGGLALFGIIFAMNSSLHSYMILAFTNDDKVALNVGYYYMANAAGRLVGTTLSGISYQWGGIESCLLVSGSMLLLSFMFSCLIPLSDSPSNTGEC